MPGESNQPLPNEPADEHIEPADASLESVEAGESQEVSPWTSLLAERDSLQNDLLRARAEMENIRKRMNRERDEERRYAALPIVRDLLPAVDNLKRAVEAGKTDQPTEAALLQGVSMVIQQIEGILALHGAQPIPAQGLPFDPHVHDALQQVPTAEHPPMTVLQELEQGYQIHNRVIRPAKVIVASAPRDEDGPRAGETARE